MTDTAVPARRPAHLALRHLRTSLFEPPGQMRFTLPGAHNVPYAHPGEVAHLVGLACAIPSP